MEDERPIDPRLREFKRYLDERVSEQHARPYSEKDDIERVLEVYTSAVKMFDDLDLTERGYHCLKFGDIKTVGDLANKTIGELLQLRNFGRTSLREVRDKLADLGLHLKRDASYLEKRQSRG
jgi:DNA-directed RNA polymerase alpha subunit